MLAGNNPVIGARDKCGASRDSTLQRRQSVLSSDVTVRSRVYSILVVIFILRLQFLDAMRLRRRRTVVPRCIHVEIGGELGTELGQDFLPFQSADVGSMVEVLDQ